MVCEREGTYQVDDGGDHEGREREDGKDEPNDGVVGAGEALGLCREEGRHDRDQDVHDKAHDGACEQHEEAPRGPAGAAWGEQVLVLVRLFGVRRLDEDLELARMLAPVQSWGRGRRG